MLNLPNSWNTGIVILDNFLLEEFLRNYDAMGNMTYKMLSEEKYRWGIKKDGGIHISTRIGGLNDLEI